MPLDTFGGGVTHPSDISFREIALAGDLVLQWPSLSESSDDVTARIMEVEPQANGFAITLPDASMVSEGQDILFRNIGTASFQVNDSSGNSIATVDAGQVKYFYLTNNQSAAGAWSVVQFGVGSSSADASLLAGLGLKAIGTTLNQSYSVVETTSDINIGASDRARLYAYTGGSHTITLPTSASVGPDFFFLVKNGGAGTITVTPSANDTIDSVSSLLIQPNDGVIIYSAGNSNRWYTVAQGRSVQFAFTQLVRNVGGSTQDVVLTSSEAQNKVITFTGTLVQSINVIVPSTVSVYYIFNNTTGPFSLTVITASGSGVAVTQGARDIVVCDGANCRRGVDNTSATTLFSEGSESAPPITFVTDPDSGLYHPGANQVGISAGGSEVMRFTGVSGAVNSFESFSAATGSPVKLSARGQDASISLLFKAKGSGEVLFEDVDFTLRNSADTTKKVAFDASGVSTNTKRTLVVPDGDGVIVLTGLAQTLTNKTIDSPVFTGNQPVENQPAPLGDVVTFPTGAVISFAGSVAPAGWLMCYGQPVSRVTYARLFAVIGTAHGVGDGSTTFNLPDCRGRVDGGKDDMGGAAAGRITAAGCGVDGTLLGATGGDQHTQNHIHGVNDPGHAHTVGINAQQVLETNPSPSPGRVYELPGGSTGTTQVVTGISLQPFGTGGSGNVPPIIMFNKIIKA